jgi:sulfate adenylyltransferase
MRINITDEQKAHAKAIADKMLKAGLDDKFVYEVVQLTYHYVGIYDLIAVWEEESNQKERDEIVEGIKHTIEEQNKSFRRMEKKVAPRGFTILLTGLSGAGKSTIAELLIPKIGRYVSLLDGDNIRENLSPELTFSKEHRDMNVKRVAFVASEITKHGGVAVCALISPYEEMRNKFKQLVEPHGKFFLIHISTPLEVCEERDPKGLYKKVRNDEIKNFTGISDPYEVPQNPSLSIDTSDFTPEECVSQIVDMLREEGCVRGPINWGLLVKEE